MVMFELENFAKNNYSLWILLGINNDKSLLFSIKCHIWNFLPNSVHSETLKMKISYLIILVSCGFKLGSEGDNQTRLIL